MSKLPVVSGQDAVKAFGKLGYAVDHQTGSHIILRNENPPHRRLTIPNHKEIAKGTLRAILCQAGLTKEELLELQWWISPLPGQLCAGLISKRINQLNSLVFFQRTVGSNPTPSAIFFFLR